MTKVNFKFSRKLRKYGAFDINACFNCGNCTAVCALSDEKNSFPRGMVRASVLGLEDRIGSSLEPWLCYYCGECSETCPKTANPGELMMSLRRYLISRYDWTGLSGLLFRNMWAYVIAFLLIAAGLFGLSASGLWSQKEWLHYGHLFEMGAIAGVAAFILLPNILRMWNRTTRRQVKKVSIQSYLFALPDLLLHMFTQKRTLTCGVKWDNRFWWFEHFVLVLGYLGLLFTTVVLNWFASTFFPIIALGYALSGVVFVITFDLAIRRLRKKTERTTFSHISDWFFVIWLFMLGLTAFSVRLLVDLDALAANFWVYQVHLTVLVQWALVIVPFGKWTHFLYRSFAIYFNGIVRRATPVAA